MKFLTARTGEKIKVSSKDFGFLNQFNWFLDRNGYPYTRVVITKLILSAARDRVRDHKNGDILDNRRQNLQLISQANNIRKAKKTTKPKSSRFKGVSWRKSTNCWRAVLSYRIQKEKHQIHLGHFKEESAAALAYNRAARRRWGRFAFQNQV